MPNLKLSFCEVNYIRENIIEVIPFEGVKIGEKEVEEYHKFFDRSFKNAFGILVNRKYHYTYTFEAQMIITKYPLLKAVAILFYDRQSEVSMEPLRAMKNHECQMEFWHSQKDEAINWLEHELAKY